MKWGPPEAIMTTEWCSGSNSGGGTFKVQFLGSLRQPGTKGRAKSPDAIPVTIRDTPEMLKFMCPHMLEEGRESVNKEYEVRHPFPKLCDFVLHESVLYGLILSGKMT